MVQYQLPFRVPQAVSQYFSSSHGAVDFGYDGVGAGTPIPAVAAGVVAITATGGGMGNRLEILHADGMRSGYCHMQSPTTLNAGDEVARGQIVGYVGNTGVSANHLHLAMSSTAGATINGSGGYAQCVDPIAYINAHLTSNKGANMSILFRKGSTAAYAVAGAAPGTDGAWFQTESPALVTQLISQFGTPAVLTDATFENWKLKFQQPIRVDGITPIE